MPFLQFRPPRPETVETTYEGSHKMIELERKVGGTRREEHAAEDKDGCVEAAGRDAADKQNERRSEKNGVDACGA